MKWNFKTTHFLGSWHFQGFAEKETEREAPIGASGEGTSKR